MKKLFIFGLLTVGVASIHAMDKQSETKKENSLARLADIKNQLDAEVKCIKERHDRSGYFPSVMFYEYTPMVQPPKLLNKPFTTTELELIRRALINESTDLTFVASKIASSTAAPDSQQ